jgi:hypothetical protein
MTPCSKLMGKKGPLSRSASAAASGVIPAPRPVVNQRRDRRNASGFVIARLATADQVLDAGTGFIFLVIEEHVVVIAVIAVVVKVDVLDACGFIVVVVPVVAVIEIIG